MVESMTEVAVKLRYHLEFTSAFHIGSGYGTAGVVDATVVRQADGNLYIPGSTIKGRVRWRLTSLLQPTQIDHDLAPCSLDTGRSVCTICNLFGSTWNDPTLYFEDARLSRASNVVEAAARLVAPRQHELAPAEVAILRQRSQVERRSQVSISRRRRVARNEFLFVSEVGQPGIGFEGTIVGKLAHCGRLLPTEALTESIANQSQPVPTDLAWLIAGLLLVEQLGGRKSRGFGNCRFSIDQLAIGAVGGEWQVVKDWTALLNTLKRKAGAG